MVFVGLDNLIIRWYNTNMMKWIYKLSCKIEYWVLENMLRLLYRLYEHDTFPDRPFAQMAETLIIQRGMLLNLTIHADTLTAEEYEFFYRIGKGL